MRGSRTPATWQPTPKDKPTLVGPYRDHLRARRMEDPAVQLFREIKELGYAESLNLLYRYITQGRVEGGKPVTTPQRFARLLLTRPENLRDKDRTTGGVHRSLPQDGRTRQPRRRVRSASDPSGGQRRQAHRLDHDSLRRRPAPPALLRERP